MTVSITAMTDAETTQLKLVRTSAGILMRAPGYRVGGGAGLVVGLD